MGLLLICAIIVSAAVLTISVRLGAAIAGIENVGFGKASKLALSLLGLSIACWCVAFLLDESGGAPAVLLIAVAPLLALPLIQRMLDASWPRTLVVWLAQGIGLTLCLVTVAIFFVPGLIQDEEAARQKMALSEMQSIGIGLTAWAEDFNAEISDEEVVGSSGPVESIDFETLVLIDAATLELRLSPAYLDPVPSGDPWGTPYEVRVATDEDNRVISVCVRCAGADGSFSGDSYRTGEFDWDDTSQDIVWLAGSFVRCPTGFLD